MDVGAYLEELVAPKRYELSREEEELAAKDLSAFVVSKLMRKKFRRRVGQDTRQSIEEKVARRLELGRPLHLAIPFGGYKHFWSPSHPRPDWAEPFHLLFMAEYVAPILAVHEPGVILEYISEDLILPRMNNYPPEALEAYGEGFRGLTDWYQRLAPKGLELRFWRVGERYDAEAIVREVEGLLPERRAAFDKLSSEEQVRETHRSERSVMWRGREDLSGLSETERRERVIESRLIELAYYDAEAKPEHLGTYYWDDDRICVCFSFGLSPDNDEYGDLTLATSHGSIVDFWIGRGVLHSHEGRLHPTIISRSQYEEAKATLETARVRGDLVPLTGYDSVEIVTMEKR